MTQDHLEKTKRKHLQYKGENEGTSNHSLAADYLSVFSAAGIPNLFTCRNIKGSILIHFPINTY